MDARRYAPATQRNREPILKILSSLFLEQCTVLEIASGTGEHASFFAQQLASCHWIPSDISSEARASITAWKTAFAVKNLEQPLSLDVTQAKWPESCTNFTIDAIVNINMIHIAPWQACIGLLAGANQLLSPKGLVYFYGPFLQKGQHTASSNLRFDQSLRERNPLWGVRELDDVIAVANQNNLQLQQVIEMPANNLSVIFSR